MTDRLVALIVTTCLCTGLAAQPAAVPSLTRSQRELLQALVSAVDQARGQPEVPDASWQSHIMRASDGSHYVAFSVAPPAVSAGPLMLYVRLATAAAPHASLQIERSAVREWLAGSRTDPRLLPRRNIAIGDMPAFGAGSIAARGATASPPGSTDLRLMELERDRQKQEQKDRNAKRRAELDGRQSASRDYFPFEDFDLASTSARADGTRILSRAFTAGPGDYDLLLAWADTSAPKAAANVRVLRRSLRLPAARTTDLETSSIILADSVGLRPAPYPPSEQASHPYSIGLMEIAPARSSRYARDSNLSVAFQLINAASTEAGMPDVTVAFRIVGVNAGREAAVASLVPQTYNANNLPGDFDLRLGHPLFAAVTAPLHSLSRGDYRLKIVVNDRIAGTSANAETEFSVVGTPLSLLAEAPALGGAFKRDALFQPATLSAVVRGLTPASPSPALARALAIAETGKLLDLLVEEPVTAEEKGIRTALTGLAFLSAGDSSAASHFQRALLQDAPAAPTQFLLGAARALQLRDPDAITAWRAAVATGTAPAVTASFLAEAFLRRNGPQEAAAALAGTSFSAQWIRVTAATQIATHRESDAIALLEGHLAVQADDAEARWLLLHALYSQLVRGGSPFREADAARFAKHARSYIDEKGTNAALAEQWLKVISSS